jgi:DMSO/TMAO reductase YedYZ molybdopterin-dependent catalytic subunit
MIIRQKEPINLETPMDQVDSFLTPTELFYVRNHFSVPALKADEYQLRVEGAVRTPCTLTLRQLRDMPAETRVATLECAGNGRVFLVPQVQGAQWGLGAVGNAEWTGVPLSILLEGAGLQEGVCEIVLEGADTGTPKEEPIPPGPVSYARSVSLPKAHDILIAYQINGRDLPAEHGYPVRAIVPGHYGMASVKWLIRIQAMTEPFTGYWQTSDYAYWDELAGKPVRRALGEMKLKSQITRPGVYETLAPKQVYFISGFAWAGEDEVEAVEVSTDAGKTWVDAQFLEGPQRYSWRRWQYKWRTPAEPGSCLLLSRARDRRGSVQPDKRDPRFGTYAIHHLLPIEVFIR